MDTNQAPQNPPVTSRGRAEHAVAGRYRNDVLAGRRDGFIHGHMARDAEADDAKLIAQELAQTTALSGRDAEAIAAAAIKIARHEKADAATKAEALREYAEDLARTPDFQPSEYDRGRVDQRHQTIRELHARADEIESA